jgi:uncharacterized protein YqeY
MSEIITRLESQIKVAMKSKDQLRLDAIRMIKSAVKNKEIELIRELSETEFFSLINTLSKQRKDSIEQFKAANRDDLVAKEGAELAILEEFLPKALSEEELNAMVSDAIVSSKATGPKDMGLVMKALKDQTTGRVDGKVLSELVKGRLQNLA